MNLSRPDADIFVPSGGVMADALARVTHLCIGAHQDDVEIMAHAGICDCLDEPECRGFGSVVVTDGAGSSRTGPYAEKTDEEMKAIRQDEQRMAAQLGKYAIQFQLGHPSADVKSSLHGAVVADVRAILDGCCPAVVYLHNPMDKHDTHVAVFLRCLAALRSLPAERRPAEVVGVEVWRGLDWLVDADKVALDSGRRPDLSTRLLETFDSQIFGGKRYDLATEGRRAANATFDDAWSSDALAGITWAMNLRPLLDDPTRDVADYALSYVERLQTDVASRIERFR